MWDRYTFFNRLLSKMCAVYVSYGVQYKPRCTGSYCSLQALVDGRDGPASGFSWRRRGVCDHRFFSC